MVSIKLKVFYLGPSPEEFEVNVTEGTTLESLLTEVKKNLFWLNENVLSQVIIVINGVASSHLKGGKTILKDGDNISIVPMIAGG